jgi:4'-phosphopantetheinyl transferase
MKIFALNDLETMDDLTFLKLLTNIPDENQKRIKKFAKPDDAKKVLLADILVRYVVASEMKISSKTIEFNHNRYGKPFLKGNYRLYFNVSHSGNWIVCAIDDEPVGIDIEKIRPIEFETLEQFFSGEEYKMLMAKNPENWQLFFFDLWTLKESYIKAVGEGLSIPLKSFTISFLKRGEIAVKFGNKLTNWTLKQYFLDPEYKIAVCGTHKAFPDNVIIKELKSICSGRNI